jgi:hypothetical protein
MQYPYQQYYQGPGQYQSGPQVMNKTNILKNLF